MSRHPEGRAWNPCGQDSGLQTALVGSDPHLTWGEREGGPLEGGEGCLAWEGGGLLGHGLGLDTARSWS